MMPLPQTLKGGPLAQLQQPNPILAQRPLQLDFLVASLRVGQYTHNLSVYLKTVQQVREAVVVGRRGSFAIDIKPDEARGGNRATVDFGPVERINVRKTGADEGEDGVIVCVAEGCADGVRGGSSVD